MNRHATDRHAAIAGKERDPAGGVCLVGAFPPPVHGVSLVNAKMREDIAQRGGVAWIIDLSPGSLLISFMPRWRRLARVVSGLALLAWLGLRGNLRTIYVGLSGSYGQVYELAFVILARVQRLRIFMHHHSYAYLRRRRVVTQMLVTAAGPAASHIVVCRDMERCLKALYPRVGSVFVLSNAAMLPIANAGRPRSALRKVGFLSNISYEKGINEFLQVMARIRSERLEITGLIAGPFMSSKVEVAVLTAIRGETGVKYVGPQYGKGKEAFLSEIDTLLFPSKYEHEADPLTVHEAMRHGVPVICSNRGCLASVVSQESGLVIQDDFAFVDTASSHLTRWYEHPDEFAAASRTTLERALSWGAELLAAREAVVGMLLGGEN